MFVYITIDEVISGSAIDADKSPDVMASPENLPDSTSEPNASCGGIIEQFCLEWLSVKYTLYAVWGMFWDGNCIT